MGSANGRHFTDGFLKSIFLNKISVFQKIHWTLFLLTQLMALVMCYAIAWTSVDQELWFHVESLGHNNVIGACMFCFYTLDLCTNLYGWLLFQELFGITTNLDERKADKEFVHMEVDVVSLGQHMMYLQMVQILLLLSPANGVWEGIRMALLS